MIKITNLNEILSDWAYRVDGGMPDATKISHLVILEKTLIECGWNVAERYELIKNLQEAKSKPDPEREKLMKQVIKYKNKDGEDDEITVGGAIKQGEEHPAYKKAKEMLGGDGEKGKKKKKDNVPKGMIKNPNYKPFDRDNKEPEFIKDPNVEEPKDKPTEEPKGEFSPVPEKMVKSRMVNVNGQLENAPDNPPHLTKEIKKKLSTTIEKMFRGEDITSEELELAQNYLKFISTESGRTEIYLAINEPKVWYPSRNKVSLFPPPGQTKTSVKTPAFQNWVNNLETKYDVFVGGSSEGAVGKKVLVPNKLTDKRKTARIEKQSDGSIKFNGKPMKKIKQPDNDVLLKAVRKNNPNMTEEEVQKRASVISRQIARYNDQIDDLANSGDFEYVDYGPVQSPEDRRETSLNIINVTEERFRYLLSKAGAENKPENKKVFDTLEKLKKIKDPEGNEKDREEYNELLNQLLVDMASSVDFKDAVADFAEVKVMLEKLSQGNSVYAPSSETFKISDIIIVNAIDTSDLGLDDADELSESLKYLNVALEFVGGESVKYKGGGAGMSDDKVRLTVYKGKETRRRLNSLLDGYYTLYPEDRDPPDYPPSDEKNKERRDGYNETKNWALENNVISEEEAEAIESYAEKRGETLYKKFLAKGAGNCMDDKEKERYKESIKQYLREMKMMQAVNNNDLEYTKFGNSNQKIGLKGGKPGKAYSEEIDGIKKPCYMNFKDDPGYGFSKTKKGCVTATPTNRNPSEIKAKKPEIKG